MAGGPGGSVPCRPGIGEKLPDLHFLLDKPRPSGPGLRGPGLHARCQRSQGFAHSGGDGSLSPGWTLRVRGTTDHPGSRGDPTAPFSPRPANDLGGCFTG